MSALPSIITPALLSAIRTHPNLPHHTWYFITATTLSVLNRPDELPKLYKYVLDYGADPISSAPSPDEQLKISRRLREALVKAGAIGGLPKSINSLLALKAVTPEHLLDEPSAYSPTSRRTEVYDVPSPEILSRGQAFFEKMYGKIAKRVMGQMDRSGTEDLGLMARLMYSYILSNTSVLSSVETSFVLIAGLIPQDVSPESEVLVSED